MSSTGNVSASNASLTADELREDRHPLDPIFKPSRVALVGASERAGSVGRTVLWNLISNPFGGIIYPVNPKRAHVLGIRAYPSLQALPEVPDLVIVCIPAEGVPALLRECVALGIPGAIVISAGFKETGERGKQLETEIFNAVQGSMRVIGPNSIGVMNPVLGLNATFSNSMARPGNVAFISQSGALCTAILDWAKGENVGFSGFVSSRFHAGCGLGRSDRLLRQRPAHPLHCHLHGIHRRREFFPLCRPRSLALQTDHRHQGRTHRRRSQGCRLAHRHADRIRRGSGSCLPPRWRPARQLHLGNLFHDRGAIQTAAPQGQPPLHRHQRRRSGRACHRRAHSRRRRTRRIVTGDDHLS